MRTLSSQAVRTAVSEFPGPRAAKVVRVSGAKLYVELDDAPGLEVEVKWSRPHPAHTHTLSPGATGAATFTVTNPPAGTGCLVLFTDRGVADGWVVAFQSWPA